MFSKIFKLVIICIFVLFAFAFGSAAQAADTTIDGKLTITNDFIAQYPIYATGNQIKFNTNTDSNAQKIITMNWGDNERRIFSNTEGLHLLSWADIYLDPGLYLYVSGLSSFGQLADFTNGIALAGTQITASALELNILDGAIVTTAELNILDGATLTTTELNYVDGVSSAIQGQLDSKMNTTGGNITNNLHIGGTLQVDGTTTLSNATTVTGLFRANGDGTRNIVSDSADLVLEAGYSTPKSLVLISDEDTTDAINIDATAGGIDIDAVGEAGQDIDITNTGGSINITATEAIATAIVLNASAGGVDITAATNDLDLVATTADVNITGATNIDLVATAGDVTMQTGDDLNVTLGDDSTWTMAAGSQITIDAATTDSITDGVLRINMDTIGTTQTGALTIDLEVVDDADALDVVYGGYITVTHTSGDADGVWGWYIDQLNTATDVVPTTALLALDNSETTNADDDVSAGIRFLDGGVAGYTYAIDMNSATIDTAAVRLQNAATINNGAAGTATFDFNRDGDSTLTIQSTGSGAADETAVVIDSEGDTDATAIFTLTTDAVAADTNIFQILHGGTLTSRLDASSYWQIDASTTANTTTEGILDINTNMTEDGAEAINLYVRSSANADNEQISGIYINLDDDASVATSALYGIYLWANDVDSSGSVIGMYLDSTLADAGIITEDDTTIGFGTPADIGSQATAYLLYETVDANSNHLNLVLPEGGATDVPVFMIGDTSINNQDLGWFDGVTNTTLALVSKDANNNDYLTLSVSDTGVATIASGQDDIILDPAGNNINPGSDDADFLGAAGTEWSNIYTEALAVNMGDATDQIVIDASTTANTTTTGVIDLDIGSTASNVGIDINSAVTDDNAIDTQQGLQITMTNNANDSDVVYGLHLAELGGAASGGNEYAIYQEGTAWDYGLYLDDNLRFGATQNQTIDIAQSAANTDGKDLAITAGAGNGVAGAQNGGMLSLSGGTGSNGGNGGAMNINGGIPNGAGSSGAVNIGLDNAGAVNIRTSENNGDITLTPHGTGHIVLDKTLIFTPGTQEFTAHATLTATSSVMRITTDNLAGYNITDITAGLEGQLLIVERASAAGNILTLVEGGNNVQNNGVAAGAAFLAAGANIVLADQYDSIILGFIDGKWIVLAAPGCA